MEWCQHPLWPTCNLMRSVRPRPRTMWPRPLPTPILRPRGLIYTQPQQGLLMGEGLWIPVQPEFFQVELCNQLDLGRNLEQMLVRVCKNWVKCWWWCHSLHCIALISSTDRLHQEVHYIWRARIFCLQKSSESDKYGPRCRSYLIGVNATLLCWCIRSIVNCVRLSWLNRTGYGLKFLVLA